MEEIIKDLYMVYPMVGVEELSLDKPGILCFCGADGAGKSSLVRFYAVWLTCRGFRVYVVWLRGTHTFASIFARFLFRLRIFRGSCNPYYGICIPRKLRRLWTWIELFSLLPILFTRFLIPRALGYVIISERGLIDFLVWLVVTLRDPGVVGSLVGRFALGLARRLCSNIYIRAEPEVLQARRRGFPEEPLLPLQLTIYDVISRACRFPTVDTSGRSIMESFKCFLEITSLGCGKRGL